MKILPFCIEKRGQHYQNQADAFLKLSKQSPSSCTPAVLPAGSFLPGTPSPSPQSLGSLWEARCTWRLCWGWLHSETGNHRSHPPSSGLPRTLREEQTWSMRGWPAVFQFEYFFIHKRVNLLAVTIQQSCRIVKVAAQLDSTWHWCSSEAEYSLHVIEAFPVFLRSQQAFENHCSVTGEGCTHGRKTALKSQRSNRFLLNDTQKRTVWGLSSCMSSHYGFGGHHFKIFGIRELEFRRDLGNIGKTVDFHQSFGQSPPSKNKEVQQRLFREAQSPRHDRFARQLTCKAASSWTALFHGGRTKKGDHPQRPSWLQQERDIYPTWPHWVVILLCLRQTSPPPQLHQLSVRDPSVTGEKDFLSLWSLHHYFGAVPLVVAQVSALFCHFEHQQLPQRRLCLEDVSQSLKWGQT